MLRTEELLRSIAAIIVLLLASVAVLAYANAILPGPPLLQTGMSHIVDLIAEGCGRGGTGATGEVGIGAVAYATGTREIRPQTV